MRSYPIVLCPELLRLIKGICGYVVLGSAPSSVNEGLDFILNAVLCYMNSMRDDKKMMDKFMSLSLKTMEQLQEMDPASSLEYVSCNDC